MNDQPAGSPALLPAAAGGRGGSWFVLLSGLADLVAEFCPGRRIEVIEGGGVMNHVWVGEGRIPLAILNPPMIVAARAGTAPFDRSYPDLRVGVANLTTNYLHLMVDESLGLTTLDELPTVRPALRFPVDRVGTVDRWLFDLTLDHLGAPPATLATWGGGVVEAPNYEAQIDLFERGEVNALWQFMGIPSPSIQAVTKQRKMRALGLPDPLISTLGPRGWAPAQLNTTAYGLDQPPVATVAMGTTLGFHAGVDEVVAYEITRAIGDHPDRVRAIHPAARDFDPAAGARDASAPLHPGAARYYRERGWLPRLPAGD